jgi:branched-chain amino acid transport system substrate-binding protein
VLVLLSGYLFLTDIQGAGALEGAELAAYEINQAGGIDVGGKTYYIGITGEDTDESNPNLDVTKGVAAAERIISYKRAQYLTGGFRTESLAVYLETIMDDSIPFISTGAATDSFCQNVLDDYDRYKYFFRNNPINSSSLGGEIIAFLAYYMGALSSPLYANRTINQFGILYEDLDWTEPLVDALTAYLPLYGGVIAAKIAYPITALQSDMDGYMSTINTNGTQILIPVISAQGGILMMSSYAAQEPGFVVIGIDVQSQLDTFWADSTGNCEFETILQALHRTNKTDLSIPFWDAYIAEYDHEPLYTASGSYDAIKNFAWAINKSQSFNANTFVTTMETITTANPLPGAGGQGAYTVSHDIQEGYPYGYTLFCQWQSGGTKIVAPSFGSIYPASLATGTYQTPDWLLWAFN